MAYLLFIDESGHDRQESPYEVLAGIAIEDRRLWPLITQLNDAQEHHFGLRLYRKYGTEIKANKLLKRKVFHQAGKHGAIAVDERRHLAQAALERGDQVSGLQLIALSQAKIAYSLHALKICRSHGCKAFASIIPNDIERPALDILRKDYAFLFERFFSFLEQSPGSPMGIVVFDENDKTKSQILLNQMEEYFIQTKTGQRRSKLIVPEPLFVHSDLTTMVQIADIVAYAVNWGVRLAGMTEPERDELSAIATAVVELEHLGLSADGFRQRGFKLIRSLFGAMDKRKGNATVASGKASAYKYELT